MSKFLSAVLFVHFEVGLAQHRSCSHYLSSVGPVHEAPFWTVFTWFVALLKCPDSKNLPAFDIGLTAKQLCVCDQGCHIYI